MFIFTSPFNLISCYSFVYKTKYFVSRQHFFTVKRMKTMAYRFDLRRIATLLSVVTLALVLLAGITGILLAFYYDPTAGGAYESLRFIHKAVSSGAIVRSLHNIAGNGLIIVAFLQILVLFLGRQLRTSWYAAWISAFALSATAVALGWTAILLDWSQISYWRVKVELGILQSLPVVGSLLHQFFTGGNGISSLTVQHMYTLHSYVFAAVAVVLAIVHLGSLLYQEWQQAHQPLDSTMSQSEAALNTDQTVQA